ncbi:MAG: prepilin peptidase [Clostridiales bacterium]|nr:prepilin peptidase [Clostridiales bacterium]
MKESLLFLILLLGLFSDLSTHKIPNKLILWGAILGSVFLICERGIVGIPILLIGLILPICILVVPYGIGALGAGDVKLFSIMPGFIGIIPTIMCMIYAFCIGAIISFIILLYNKCLIERLKFFFKFLFTVGHTGKLISYYDVNKDGYKHTMHFSLAILLGTCFYFVQQILY